jgi:hypothetical protein
MVRFSLLISSSPGDFFPPYHGRAISDENHLPSQLTPPQDMKKRSGRCNKKSTTYDETNKRVNHKGRVGANGALVYNGCKNPQHLFVEEMFVVFVFRDTSKINQTRQRKSSEKPNRPKNRPKNRLVTRARGWGYYQKRSVCRKSEFLRPIGEN